MRRYLVLALILLALSASITYSILIWDQPAPELKKEEGIDRDNRPTDLVNLLAQSPANPQKIKVDLETKEIFSQVILERVYLSCGHTILEEISSDSPLLNLSRQEFLRLYPGWKIIEEQGSRIVLQMKINDLCPEDTKKRYVGEQGGFVTIFFGLPGMNGQAFKVTDIPIRCLPEDLQEKLRQGIITESEDHLISVIDGLAVYYFE